MKYYIATGFANKECHNHLMRMLQARGHTITYDWTREEPAVPRGPSVSQRIAELEVRGVVDADIVFVLLPGGKGTHVEIGAALATDTPVVMVPLPQYDQDEQGVSIFYFHRLVWRSLNYTSAINSAEQFVKSLRPQPSPSLSLVLDPTHTD